MNIIARTWASLKVATTRLTMRWSRGSSFGLTWLAGTQYDYQRAAGDGRTNAAVMACVRWVQRALPEAPLIVVQRNTQGELKPAPGHPLQALLESPNPHYSGLHLLSALVADLMLTGNAYLLKVRAGSGRPVELWWVPSTMIEPRWADDGSEFIGWYDYAIDGQVTTLDVGNVVHIRQGFDPRNIRKGLSDLECLFREIATDNEAAQMSATLLRNQAIPGVILSPEGDTMPSQADLEAAKNNFVQKFGGDRRGEPMVMAGPTKVSVLSWSPEQMNLRSLRQIPEERITAVFGIPAAVVGLGTGLEQTKVGATMSESREQAYESCLIPMQRLITAELQMQLVPDFGNPATLRVQFDLSEVRVLQDDQNALHTRAREDLTAGLLTLNQALQMIGEEPVQGEAGDIRYVPNTVTVKTLDSLIPEEQPAELSAPTPLRALPAPADDEAIEADKAHRAGNTKALSDDDLIARYEAGLATLSEDLADDLMGAFEEIADVAASRALSFVKAQDAHAPAGMGWSEHVSVSHLDAGTKTTLKAETVSGLVTETDHEPIRRLLRGYVLRSMRQAAEDLAPLTGDAPVRITRNMPAVKAAMADMESRIAGIAATTDADFGRLIAKMERRPGSVSLDEIREALHAYVGESYQSRAALIARTELGYAHARGVLLVAEKSGLASRVHVHDGDGDAACRGRNGTTATLEEAAGIGLLHPSCRLRLIPILEAA